jgi:hypothetical protein
MTDDERETLMVWLDDLRDSGVTNMFGAVPYLRDTWDFDEKTARAVLSHWMETFAERHKPCPAPTT